jgi:hypothetical protein
MNQKMVLGFVAGMILASGLSYVVTYRRAGVPPAVPRVAPVTAPAVTAPPALAAGPTLVATPAVVAEIPKAAAAKIAKPKPTPVPVIHEARVVSVPAPAVLAPVVATTVPEPPVAAITVPVEPPAPVAARAPAPLPNIVTVPPGTPVAVRLSEGLSSERNRAGDEFAGTLDQALVIDGFVLAERGARAEGRVTESVAAGRVRGLAQLGLELTRLHTSDGQNVPIRTTAFLKQGPESKRDDTAKIGLGAALGAIIGAAAGGGKGAAIGAAAGGAAGGVAAAATRGKPAVLAVETLVQFRIEEPVTLTERLN